MPRIDTYTANLADTRGIKGQVQTEIDIGSAQRPGYALQNLGQTIEHAGLTAEHVAEVQRQRQQEQDIRWVGDAKDQLSRVLIQWQQDNAHREDVGDAYRKFADEQVAEYEKSAPNTRAAAAFRQHVLPAINSDWEQNLKRGEQTRLNNFKASELKGSESDLDAFRYRMANGEGDAARDLLSYDLQSRLTRIDSAYGKIAPLTAASMKESATIDAVLGALESDPKFAKEILDSSKSVDAQSRSVLLNKIEAANNQMDDVAAFRMTTALDTALKNAAVAGTMVAIPPRSSFEVFKKHADLQYERFVSEAKQQNESVTQWDTIRSYAPEYQAAHLAKMAKTDKAYLVPKLAQKAHQVNEDIQHGNVAGHIASNYDDVKSLFTAAQNATNPKDRQANLTQAYAKTLYYSGYAPHDTDGKLLVSQDEAKKFLGMSTGEFHILSVDQANKRGAELNGMSPQDLMLAINGMGREYGSEQMAAIAFNDLATLPKEGNRLPAAVQLAAAMPSPELAIKFLGVIKTAKDIKPLPDATVREFRDYLYKNTDGQWTAFRRTFNRDANQRAPLLDDFENAILKYSYSINGEGSNPKESVQKAVKDTITGSFGFANINGEPFMISRERGIGKPLRTDDEIKDIGRRLGVSLRDFPLQQLNLKDPLGRTIWPQVDAIQNPVGKLQYVRDAITSRGFFVTEANGQAATVYVADESGKGTVQQLRDKTGRPFEIAFDNLPPYTITVPNLIQSGYGSVGIVTERGTTEQPITPKKTYDIMGKTTEPFSLEGWRKAEESDYWGGLLYPFKWYRDKPTTNWPVAAPQFKNQQLPLNTNLKL